MTFSIHNGMKAGYEVRNAAGKVVFDSESKTECITYAQRRNGFAPVDGDEQTYARQVMEARGKAKRMSSSSRTTKDQ
jgi:hypothetical protein